MATLAGDALVLAFGHMLAEAFRSECWERAPNCCEFSLVTIEESVSYALMAAQKSQGKEESLAKAGCPRRVFSLCPGSKVWLKLTSRGIW